MTKQNQVWVTPTKNSEWKVKQTLNDKASRIIETKKDAVEFAKKLAISNKVELIIQKQNGKIQEKNTYKKDPYPPKG